MFNKETQGFVQGTQITYCPEGTDGDLTHPAAQDGFISENTVPVKGWHLSNYYCRFWHSGEIAKLNGVHGLRTRKKSILVPTKYLTINVTRLQSVVNATIKKYKITI